ncbi:MAG TPA: hypothetical protein VFU43_12320 [Streptosporangiaceae bacterium]|nr:hypothetical protein [Streptosporangiaceae bacterium]
MDNEKDQRPLADRRAGQDVPAVDEEHDFAAERTPSPSDPPNAPADAPGGEDDGYAPQTRPTGRGLRDRIKGLLGRRRG